MVSTFTWQLGLNVHSAYGALLIGDQPLVNTHLVEKVHTGKSLGNRVQVSESSPSGVTQDAVNSSNRWV